MKNINFLLLIILLIIIGCKKNSDQVTNPINNIEPEFSTVMEHGTGELCYYPRASHNGRYVAIEREEIVSPPGYVAHIWLFDIKNDSIRQLTANPAEGKYDDRNLRFRDDDSFIYFLRTHWHSNGSYESYFCRIPIDGNEQDVETIIGNNMIIYRFDFIPEKSNLLVAYYNTTTQTYCTGLFNVALGSVSELSHLNGLRHNCLVPLPDGSGFIAATGKPNLDLSSYKLKKHYFGGQASQEYSNLTLDYILWTLSINPAGDKLLVHQGVCTKSKTHYIPINYGTPTQILTEYPVPRDAAWGPDSYIYFTVNGDVMRYGPFN